MSTCSGKENEKTGLSRMEIREIEAHRKSVSEAAGHEVDIEIAIEDWLENHAAGWRRRRMQEHNREQIREIQKHKWIESEKAGRDLDEEAVRDWIKRYAEQWRKWKELQVDGLGCDD